MRAVYLIVALCCISGHVYSTSSPTPTISNPECPSMHHIANGLQKGIKRYTQKGAVCIVNQHCTGIVCNDTAHGGKDFYLKMELNPCDKPKLHLILKYPSKGVDTDQELTSGQKNIGKLMAIKITMNRDRNILHINAGVCILNPINPNKCMQTIFPLVKDQNICLNMKHCKNYNTSNDFPCSPLSPPTFPWTKPSGHTSTSTGPGSSVSTSVSTRATIRPTTAEASTKSSTRKRTPAQPTPTTHRGSTKPNRPHTSSGKTFTSTGSTKPHTPESGKPFTATSTGKTTVSPDWKVAAQHKHRMSVGTAVGIGFACLAGVFVIIVAIFYFKRLRRSRLRAAYYNDISMNDPLYEDFGPEIA